MNELPFVIELPTLGSDAFGYLSVIESPQIPFDVKRAYWVYSAPDGIGRGFHAHKCLQQVLCCLHGQIKVEAENGKGWSFSFELDRPNMGLYMPPWIWHTFKLLNDGILLSLTSDIFKEDDYMREYNNYLELIEKQPIRYGKPLAESVANNL